MAFKVYTTYLSNMKNAPEDAMKAIIMRFPPFVDTTKVDVIHVPELSPNNELFKKYKQDKDWEAFKEGFENQIISDPDTIKYLELLVQAIEDKDGNDVVLVCCEKDANNCHRTLIADYLKFSGYEVEEL